MDGNKVKIIMAYNIKENRKRLELTQAKLAEVIGSSTSYIGEIETAKKFPSANYIGKIASALNIKPYELLLDPNETEETQFNYSKEKIKEEILTLMEKEIDYIINKNLNS